MVSSLSKLLRMRRKPFSRRKSRSVSLRRRSQVLVYEHGSERVERCGTTGMRRRWRASCLGSLPAQAQSHDEVIATRKILLNPHQFDTGRRIASLTGSQGADDDAPSIHDKHVNCCRPSASGLADELRSACFRESLLPGFTLTIMRSRQADPIFMMRMNY